MNRTLTLISGILLIFTGMGLVMPAVAQLRELSALSSIGVGLLLLGLTLTVGGVGIFAYGARRLRA